MKNIIVTKTMAKLVSTAIAAVSVAGGAVALNPNIDFKDILPGKDTEIVSEAAETKAEDPEDGTVKENMVNKVAVATEETAPVDNYAEEIAEAMTEVETEDYVPAASQPMNGGEGMSWGAASADEMDELKIQKQREQAERDRIIAEKKAAKEAAKKAAEEAKKSEEQKAAEKAEQERIAAEKAAAEKAEQERIAAEKAAAEKAAAEKAEQERIAAEKAAAEKAEQERIAAEQAAAEWRAAEQAAWDYAYSLIKQTVIEPAKEDEYVVDSTTGIVTVISHGPTINIDMTESNAYMDEWYAQNPCPFE